MQGGSRALAAAPGKNGRGLYGALTIPGELCRGLQGIGSGMRVQHGAFAQAVVGNSMAQRSQRASGRFSLDTGQSAGRAAAAQAPIPAAALEGLIALQAVGDTLERRRRAVKRGGDLLDLLDQLKVAVLEGRVPVATLGRIAEQLKGRRELAGDSRLDDILAHIELRAAVELAKLGRS